MGYWNAQGNWVSGPTLILTGPGGTAEVGDVLTGETFTNGDGPQTGTMPNNGSLGTITPTTTSQNIPAGYTSGGTVAGDAELLPENIKEGVTIFGVLGTYTGA
ncbi:hypothetical protein [Paenibacillus koleovorans]|uniref:hypothetical protein n=1 Tax=Paenibacillus koleovorans TaxID=121608 RepID=UPI000FD87AA9|nr:hypothetical protein [Paenibacillus koleovorans]